jgi:hypothetical protein
MFQFIYDEVDSNYKQREVYYLYYKDKLYFSKPLLIPVKLEISRNERYILLNNILIDSDRQMCEDIFKFIILAKNILDIEDYIVNENVNSGILYKQIYQKNII